MEKIIDGLLYIRGSLRDFMKENQRWVILINLKKKDCAIFSYITMNITRWKRLKFFLMFLISAISYISYKSSFLVLLNEKCLKNNIVNHKVINKFNQRLHFEFPTLYFVLQTLLFKNPCILSYGRYYNLFNGQSENGKLYSDFTWWKRGWLHRWDSIFCYKAPTFWQRIKEIAL